MKNGFPYYEDPYTIFTVRILKKDSSGQELVQSQ
jgi:hypothetical protein